VTNFVAFWSRGVSHLDRYEQAKYLLKHLKLRRDFGESVRNSFIFFLYQGKSIKSKKNKWNPVFAFEKQWNLHDRIF
jgi:hypothetical protein